MAVRDKKAPTRQRTPRSVSINDVRVIVQEMLDSAGVSKSQNDLQQIAQSAATKAVHDTLMLIGLNVQDPLAAQEMFSGLREVVKTFASDDFQKDMLHIRKWRLTMDNVQSRSLMAVVGLAATATALSLWPFLRGAVEK